MFQAAKLDNRVKPERDSTSPTRYGLTGVRPDQVMDPLEEAHREVGLLVDVFPRTDAKVQKLLEALAARREPSNQLIVLTAFSGDRLDLSEYAAVVSLADQTVGMATLGPTDEMGTGGPTILGVWIEYRPEVSVLDVGMLLFRSLTDESLRRYGRPATFTSLSPRERLLAQEVVKKGIPLHHQQGPFLAPE